MARVVVIGAGLSGLAAAARLARLRHDVVVCERSAELGGQAGRYEQDGFAFDTGPTLLHLPAGYRDLFVKTGKTQPLESVLDLEPVDPAVRWRFADGTVVDLPNASRGGTLDVLEAAFGAEAAAGWDAFLGAGSAIWAQFRQGFVTAPPSRWRDAVRTPAGRARLAALQPARSLAALMDRHLHDPHLRQAAGSYPLRLGSDPRRAATLVAIWPYLDKTFGTWRVAGGIRALVAAIAERAEKRGARLRTDCAVQGVDVTGGAVTGVRLHSGERLDADVVVAAVDTHALALLLHAGVGPRNLMRTALPGHRSASAVTLLLALRGADPAFPPTVSFPAEPEREYDDIFAKRAQPSPDPTVWLSPGNAPPGCTALTAQVSAPRAHVGPARRRSLEGLYDWTAGDSDRVVDAYGRDLIDVLDQRGFDISSRLMWHEVRSPLDLKTVIGCPDGAMAGTPLHGRRALFRRPNVTGIRGLFHVGACAHPGPGVDFAPLGAALVADAVGRAR